MTPQSIQKPNYELGGLMLPFLQGTGYENMPQPIGDFGVWNGQFEEGPDARPEGWEIQATGTQVLTRTTGGLAGNYCMMGGDTGAGVGPILLSLRYIPVDETRAYYVGGAFRASAVTGTVNFGVYCYSAAKAYLGTAWPLTAVAPGVAWVRYERRVGAGTATTFPAGTRYVRVMVQLQTTAVLPGVYSYCDDIQFQQMKVSRSSLLILDSNYASNVAAANNNTVVQLVHCTLNLTLTEPGYIWAFANSMLSCDIVRTNSMLCYLTAGGVTVALTFVGQDVVNVIKPVTLCGRTAVALAAGVQAVNFSFAVINAGDVASCYRTYMSAFWVRSA